MIGVLRYGHSPSLANTLRGAGPAREPVVAEFCKCLMARGYCRFPRTTYLPQRLVGPKPRPILPRVYSPAQRPG